MKELVVSNIKDAKLELLNQKENLLISFLNVEAHNLFIKHIMSKDCKYTVKTKETIKDLAILDYFLSPNDKKIFINIIY